MRSMGLRKLSFLVSLAASLASTAPVNAGVLDRVVSPELGMDTPMQSTSAETQTIGDIAFDGTNFFVVWADARVDRFYTMDIYGARVTPAGEVLDPIGIPIAVGKSNQLMPVVAFDGTNFMVVWSDLGLHGARVAPNGTVLDPGGLKIATGDFGGYPDIAFNGSHFLVASQAQALRVSTAGMALDAAPLPLAGLSFYDIAVASNGADFLVVGRKSFGGGYNEVAFARVSSAGMVLDNPAKPVFSAPMSDQGEPDVDFDGTNYFVVWSHNNGSGVQSAIKAARISPAGAVLDSPPKDVSPAVSGGAQLTPRTAFNGSEHLISWSYSAGMPYEVRAARMSKTMSPVGAPLTLFPGIHSAVAAGGGNELIAWNDHRVSSTGYHHVWAGRIDAAGSLLDPDGFPVSTSANAQRQPAVAFDGQNFLVVWQDFRNPNGPSIYGARVSRTGMVLDMTGFPVVTGVIRAQNPAVAFGGGQYLVVWSIWDTSSLIYGLMLDSSGMAIGAPIVVGTSSFVADMPAVTFDGTNFLVAWQDRTTETMATVRASRVSLAGQVIDAGGIDVAPGATNVTAPGVASIGGSSWIVWQDNADGMIRGSRMLADGTVDAAAVAISAAPGTRTVPAVASDGAGYYVVWPENRTGTWDIYGARVTAAGTVVDVPEVAIETAAGNQTEPSIVYDGDAYVIAWQDDRSGNMDVYGARIDAAGAVIDTGWVLSQEATTERLPIIASDSAGTSVLAYERFDFSSPFGTDRIRARMITPPLAKGTSCLGDMQCSSGFCVDGVCCDTACGGNNPSDCQVCSMVMGASSDGTCGPAPTGISCRPAQNECDVEEVCNGASLDCPADAAAADGTPCPDGLMCNGEEICEGGACAAGPPPCQMTDACTQVECSEQTGCKSVPIAGCCVSDDSCNDGNACTMDSCIGNACRHDAIIPCGPGGGTGGGGSGGGSGPKGCVLQCGVVGADDATKDILGLWVGLLAVVLRRRAWSKRSRGSDA